MQFIESDDEEIRKMKILFISGLLSYGGTSKLIYDMLPRMKTLGHDCELLILTDKQSKYIDELNQKGIPVYVIPKIIKRHFTKIRYIKRWIETRGYDVVHVHLFPTIYYCSIAKRMLGSKCPPLIMTEHNTDNRRRHKAFLRPLERAIYIEYDHIISISEKTQYNLCKWLGCEENDRFSVVENGIDVEGFRNANALPREELFPVYRKGDVLLLTVGSFTAQKNHENLIKAMTLLPDNFKLLLAGEGPLFEDIKDRVAKEGIEKRIVFLGFRRDIANIMHTVDVLVIPSLWEGFGLIAAEGMACGLPMASSNVPGLAEVVGEVGEKFDPIDANDIKEAISRVVLRINDPTIKAKLFERAKKYDIKETALRYLNVYKSLIEVKYSC